MYTHEQLKSVRSQDGHDGLRQIGNQYGVKSTSSDQLINKILQAQDKYDVLPPPPDKESTLTIIGLEDLTVRRRDMQSPEGNYFPALVGGDKIPEFEKTLQSFAHRWGFNKIEFFLKFQAFRLYKDGQHVDWIGLNEVIRRYELKIQPAAKTLSRRLYTAPSVRAYK